MQRGRWPAGLAWGLAALAVGALVPAVWLAALVAPAAGPGGPDLDPVSVAAFLPVVLATVSAPRSARWSPVAGPGIRWAGCCWAWAWG